MELLQISLGGITIALDYQLHPQLVEQLVQATRSALRARGYGIEHWMEYGKELATVQAFINEHAAKLPPNIFARICEEYLETSEADARYRIACTQTWHEIAAFIEANALDVAMPTFHYHIAQLFDIPLERRGDAWVKFWTWMNEERKLIRASDIKSFVRAFLALPAPPDPEPEKEEDQDDEEDEEYEFDDLPVDKSKLPPKIKPAKTDFSALPGKGSNPARSDVAREAVNRIVALLGPGWNETLADPAKIIDEDVILWANLEKDNIVKVSRLVLGNYSGVRRAIKMVTKEISDKSRIWDLQRQCVASGGKYDFDLDGFHYSITRTGGMPYDDNRDSASLPD